MNKESVDVDHFRDILEHTKGEREATSFLSEAPWIPYWTFCTTSGHDRYAIFEFPLGSSYQCDLLLLNSYSGTWEAFFIEFEPVDDPVFTKAGVPSKRLAIAQRQIDDWRNFIKDHSTLLRRDMVRYAKGFDRLGYSIRGEEPSNLSGDRLSDPSSFLHVHFKIVIGRSRRMSKEQRALMGRYRSGHDVELVTYDRLLHLAELRYEHKHRDNLAILNRPI
jgi:hypothetical protein